MGRSWLPPIYLSRCAKVTAIPRAIVRATSNVFKRDGDESVPGCENSQYATTGYDYCVSPMFLSAIGSTEIGSTDIKNYTKNDL